MAPSIEILHPAATFKEGPRGMKMGKYMRPSLGHSIEGIEEQFRESLDIRTVVTAAQNLHAQLKEGLTKGDNCMLPSFCHTLPTGQECGTFLAIDVGGSKLRAALIRLGQGMQVLERRDYPVDDGVRSLVGKHFFTWMAHRISDFLSSEKAHITNHAPLSMGVAWSFAIQQKSIRDGTLMPMGKNFKAAEGLLGSNVANLISDACAAQKLNVEVSAIVNDSSSSFLSGAFLCKSSHVALILGTGLNAAVYLPANALAKSKFGDRPIAWCETARHVLVNTELSLFGHKTFPETRWDRLLKRDHPNPDFQPLEHFTSGRYLGEVVRLVLSDSIASFGLFGGLFPQNFEMYALGTDTIAAIEADSSPSLSTAAAVMNAAHPLPKSQQYTRKDLGFVRRVVTLVSSRATAFIAAGVVALCALRLETQGEESDAGSDICVGCNGSVIEKYPNFRQRTQEWIDTLTGRSAIIKLKLNGESALLGAAVAVACQ